MACAADTLAELEAVYRRWLPNLGLYPLHAVVGGYAANMLPGDPVWINLVGGSGYGKSETLHVLDAAPLARRMSTLTGEAALLSGSARRDHAKDATGGVLVEIGPHGVLVLKDFTTILSMRHEPRGEILAALREVFDGSWVRDIGEGGGRKLHWAGKCGLITGCTTAWDRAHAVLAAMGERFLTPRVPDLPRIALAEAAIANAGHELQMRAELAAAGAALLESDPGRRTDLGAERIAILAATADVVTLARSPIDRDHMGEIEFVPDPEAPTRFVKSLAQLYAGLCAIGMSEPAAWATMAQVGLDCIPKLRRRCVTALMQTPGASTSLVAGQVGHPSRTTRRALEDLVAHGLADRDGDGDGRPHRWTLTGTATSAFTALAAATIGGQP